MKRLASLAVLLIFALLCLAPAAIHALRGIQIATIIHTDCISLGSIKTKLLDKSSPVTYSPVFTETKDNQNRVHGWIGYGGNTVDATSYGHNQASMAFAPGSTLGNASGNNRKHQTSLPGTALSANDTGDYEVKASCIDCAHAVWAVTLKQRTWQKISATWTPAIDASGNLVPAQVPEWNLRVQSTNINGEIQLLDVVSTPGAGFTSTTTVTCGNLTTGIGSSVNVTELGTTITDPDGNWTSSAWSTDSAYNVLADAYWDVNNPETFACDQTATANPKNVSVDIRFRLAIEDKSNPAPAFDKNVKSLIVANPEYGTLILIWTIEVSVNCNSSTTSCPCNMYTKTPDPGQPNVP